MKGEYANSDHHGYVLITVEGLAVTVDWKVLLLEKGIGVWRTLDSFSYTIPARRQPG